MPEAQNHAATEPGRGRDAQWPSEIPARGWKDILWRVWGQIGEDRVMLIAAGGTFYLLLALFPALTAFVSAYGLIADPATVVEQISALSGVIPSSGLDIISERLRSLASQDSGALGFGFIIGFLLAFWSANSGVKTLFEALNIAYGEREKRSFIKLNLTAFAFTFGAIVAATLLIGAVGILPVIFEFIALGAFVEALLGIVRWMFLMALIAVGLALLYRFGPSRERAKWRWLTWGGSFATIVWLIASIGFSFYLRNFANYEATYGSLGAVIGFMVWTWVSLIVLIVGAEVNAEMEHQTAEDSTTGPEKPMGERGAVMADTLGRTSDQ